MNIAAIKPVSLSDYPGKPAALVFAQGCNFRCGYCHNPQLIEPQGDSAVAEEDVLSYLEGRRGRLQGVVVSGGEPLLQDGLVPFLEKLKRIGYMIKLDTNGSCPGVLRVLIKRNLVDYVAMDIKGPLKKYGAITGVLVDTDKIVDSIRTLMEASGVDYEFRTTVVKSQLSPGDLEFIGEMIKGARRYILQKYVPSNPLDVLFGQEGTYTGNEFAQIVSRLNRHVQESGVR